MEGFFCCIWKEHYYLRSFSDTLKGNRLSRNLVFCLDAYFHSDNWALRFAFEAMMCLCLMIFLSISFDIAFCNLQLKLVQYPLLMTTIRCWMYIAGGYLLQHLYFVNLMFFSQVYWNECICLWYRCNFFYSDITALAKDRAYTHINLDEMTIHQVLCFPIPFNLIINTCYQVVGFLFIMITFLFCPSCRDLFLVSSLSLFWRNFFKFYY